MGAVRVLRMSIRAYRSLRKENSKLKRTVLNHRALIKDINKELAGSHSQQLVLNSSSLVPPHSFEHQGIKKQKEKLEVMRNLCSGLILAGCRSSCGASGLSRNSDSISHYNLYN